MMDKYFEYRKHKTNFKTEVIAGVTTFLTMAYIMFPILKIFIHHKIKPPLKVYYSI